MTMRTAGDLDLIRHRMGNSPRVFVESGTFMGKTTRWAAERFDEVHTIELSPELYERAVRELVPLGVTCHHGDTRDVLPGLATAFQEPVVWFLDAHWLDREHAAGAGTELPLEDELVVLAARPYRDIVIVDDVASFGRDYQPGWKRVSLEWIGHFFPKARVMRHKDCAVVYR